MNTKRREHELGEIKALTAELVDRFERIQEDLDRIAEAQEKRLAALAPGESHQASDKADSPPLVAFVHIPKTAGGTVTNMFARAYSRAAVHKAGNYVRGPEKTERKVANRRSGGWERWVGQGGRVTVGHVPYGLFREHLPANTRYMTFLRDPVDRVLSHYYRHIHRPDLSQAQRTEREQRGKITATSLEEALEKRPQQLRNLATRFLCDDPSLAGELPPDALENAKANLRKFSFVGIQERFVESVVLLQRMLGLELVPYLDRHVSIDRPSAEETSDEPRKLIEKDNRLDAELYSFGRKLFDDAAASDAELAVEAETLRVLSAAINEDALNTARNWLDRRLPPGSTEAAVTLQCAAKADGVPVPALKRVRGLLQVETRLDDDLEEFWTRPGPDAHEPSPADHRRRTSVVTRQDGVSTLVNR